MMNQINSIQQPLGPVNFSEEELRKLAMLLQQIPDGEGLATINQDEAELMKSYGGSGTPLPGTQGLGPGGGPVRSYEWGAGSDEDIAEGEQAGGEAAGGYGYGGGGDSGGSSSSSSAGGDPGQEDYGGDSSGSSTSSSSLGDDPFAQSEASYTGETNTFADIQTKAKAHNSNTIRFEKDPRIIQQYNLIHGTTGAGDVSGDGGNNNYNYNCCSTTKIL